MGPQVDADAVYHLRESAIEVGRRLSRRADFRSSVQRLENQDPSVAQILKDLGYFGLLVPEEHGGIGGSLSEMAVILQELANGLIPSALIAEAVLATQVLMRCPACDLRGLLLAEIAGDAAKPVVALDSSKPSTRGSAFCIAKTGYRNGEISVSGAIHNILGSRSPSGHIVPAQTEEESMLLWIPVGTEGVTTRQQVSVDGGLLTSLELLNVETSASACLAREKNLSAVGSWLEPGIGAATVMTCAELVGVMGRAFDVTIDYMKTRHQFGRAIGSFQALQHSMADQFVQKLLAAGTLQQALAALEAGTMDAKCLSAICRAKSRCSKAALLIGRQGVQFHGAMGFTEEAEVGLCYKRSIVLAAQFGSGTVHRRRYSELC